MANFTLLTDSLSSSVLKEDCQWCHPSLPLMVLWLLFSWPVAERSHAFFLVISFVKVKCLDQTILNACSLALVDCCVCLLLAILETAELDSSWVMEARCLPTIMGGKRSHCQVHFAEQIWPILSFSSFPLSFWLFLIQAAFSFHFLLPVSWANLLCTSNLPDCKVDRWICTESHKSYSRLAKP